MRLLLGLILLTTSLSIQAQSKSQSKNSGRVLTALDFIQLSSLKSSITTQKNKNPLSVLSITGVAHVNFEVVRGVYSGQKIRLSGIPVVVSLTAKTPEEAKYLSGNSSNCVENARDFLLRRLNSMSIKGLNDQDAKDIEQVLKRRVQKLEVTYDLNDFSC